MSFRYRCIPLVPAFLLAGAVGLSAAFLVTMPGLWRLAAGLSGSYSILVVLLVGATIVAG